MRLPQLITYYNLIELIQCGRIRHPSSGLPPLSEAGKLSILYIVSRSTLQDRGDPFVSTNKPPSSRESRSPGSYGAERRGRRMEIERRLFFFGEDDFEGEATVLDLSTHGCRVTSLTEVTVGQSLKLSLFLQDQQWPLRIEEAIVRWVEGQSFGLEFAGIRPAQRERLRALIMKAKD